MKAESLHFSGIWAISFKIHCGNVENQNLEKKTL